MEIEWNIPESALAPIVDQGTPMSEAEARAKLEREMAAMVAASAPPPVASNPVAELAPTDSQESQATQQAVFDPQVLERLYTQQAQRARIIDQIADKLLTIAQTVSDPDTMACALGRALVVMQLDMPLVMASLDAESASIPQRGDRVQEANGSTGTVVGIVSLKEVIVKWDHVSKAMRSPVEYIRPLEEGRTNGNNGRR